ncbi:MAG: hypothetical protein J2P35_10950 [Actinobacteria bacterium]|nr:hypothetical protein [Actinomycetota bacterium]MBO0784957.1 hypothetical protein [Actinomycetota bacterium]MBO0813588.1 hypothetical protein [Actinomycetota bacterium]
MTARDARRRLGGRHPARWPLAAAGLAAVAVTAAIYLAGRMIQPDYASSLFGADAFALKSLLATIVLGLAGVQVLLALWIFGRLPRADSAPRQVPLAHRLIGFAAFALTVPIALHCLTAYGVQFTSPRVAVHSVAGCFFYGTFAAKVLLVRSRRVPGWVLPVAGGALAVLAAVLWYTSALWYYSGFQLPVL